MLNFVKNIDLDSKISTDLLIMLGEKKAHENVNKINDLTYLLGKNFFTHAGFQSYLIFHSLFKTLTLHSLNYDKVTASKLKGLSVQKIELPDIILQPEVSCSNKRKIFLKLSNSLLEQKKLTFEYRKLINMYLVF